MEESLEAFRSKLESYRDEDIQSILHSLDRERYPDRYRAALEEARKRKDAGGMAAAAIDPASKYKTLWPRIGAGILDAVLLFVGMMVVLRITGYSMEDLKDAPPLLRVGVSLPGLLYQVLMHWKYGATLGKMAFRIRVVDFATEGPIRFGQSVMRDLVPVVAALLPIPGWYLGGPVYRGLRTAADLANSLWAWAEIITALFNPKRRAVHDFLADTVCIRV